MSDYEIFKKLVDNIDVLISKHVTSEDSDFRQWQTRTERFLSKYYGKDSEELNSFLETSFSPIMYFGGQSKEETYIIEANSCKMGLESTKDTFTVYLEEIKESISSCTPNSSEESSKRENRKIFIVHGHDEAAKIEIARFLEHLDFEPIILHEQADKGLTIIEKIESYSNVGFAVVLYTECDLGRAKEDDESKQHYRARQNVVFEHGFLIGKLKRENVCALVKGNVETPGDISGVVYTLFDSAGGWKLKLLKNMQAAGYEIDTSKLID